MVTTRYFVCYRVSFLCRQKVVVVAYDKILQTTKAAVSSRLQDEALKGGYDIYSKALSSWFLVRYQL
jgi:hypothetical protein